MTREHRRQKGEGALFQRSSDGIWLGVVDLGYDERGNRVRKTVSSKRYAVAQKKLTQLKKDLADTGMAPSPRLTVAKWLETWLGNVRVKPSTMGNYRSTVDRYLVPGIGRRRLADLRAQHVRDMLRDMERRGLSASTVHRALRITRTALNAAVADGLVARNVAEHVKAPSLAGMEQQALTAEQARTLLRSVPARDPMAARWAVALLLGLRQGEALGLEWSRVDLEAGTIDLSWQLQRLPFRHGCDGTCGRKRAGSCPQRVLDVPSGFAHRPLSGALALTRPKSAAGYRVIPIPSFVVTALRNHREWHGPAFNGLVFARADGTPIDPSEDSAAWHAALQRAGLPSLKLHAARHTTATLLLELDVDARIVQTIMGHSTAAMTRAYQHGSREMQRRAMDQMGALFEIEG